MDLRHLRCFVAVAEELHFGRAAQRLHVAQPAVSQTIAALERELGLVLFERSSREVALTPAGQTLLLDATAVLERAELFQEAAGRLKAGSAGRVSIGVAPALPPRVLTDVLAAARRAAPGVRTVAKSLGRSHPATALSEAGCDLVLGRGPLSAPGVASVLVASEPVGIALPADHPLAQRQEVPAALLNGEALAGFARREDPVQFDRLFSALRDAGLSAPGELHESPAGAVDASLRLVAAAEAVSIKLRSEVLAFADPAVVWRPLANLGLSVDVHLAWRMDLANPAARTIVGEVAARFADQPDADVPAASSKGGPLPERA